MGSLGDRMKRYEAATASILVPRLPTLIRLDGKAFHTFTQGMAKPFDHSLAYCMYAGARDLCEEASGCILREVYDAPNPVKPDEVVTRSRWVVDQEIPVFTQDHAYILRFV